MVIFMLMDIFSSFDEQNGNFLNSGILMWAGSLFFVGFVVSVFWWGPSRWGVLLNLVTGFIWDQLSRTKGKNIRGFGGFLCALFLLFLLMNLSGLFPYVFSATSHLVVTLTLAMPLWLSLIISSVLYKPDVFVAGLLPVGAPSALNPFLVLIETVSISVRPITLSVRLAANMGAGHIVIGLIGGYLSVGMFSYSLSSVLVLVGLESFYFLFEIGVCLIQAYIFSLLLTLYSDEHA